MDISVIIPAYNSEKTIKELTRQIFANLSEKYSFEIIFIFDNGKQNTWMQIKEVQKKYGNKITAVRLASNYGQHRALQYGLGIAKGDFIITMDEDLQHDPGDIERLLDKQKESDYDVVYGRFINLNNTALRNRLSSVLRRILKKFIPNLYENYSPYRLIKKDITVRISTMICPYTLIDDFLSRVTHKIAFENIRHHKRMEGGSSYTFIKLIKHGLFIVLAYSKLIPYLLAISGVLIFIGILFYVIITVNPDLGNSDIITTGSLIGLLGISGLFIILSFTGAWINYKNTKKNTMPLRIAEC